MSCIPPCGVTYEDKQNSAPIVSLFGQRLTKSIHAWPVPGMNRILGHVVICHILPRGCCRVKHRRGRSIPHLTVSSDTERGIDQCLLIIRQRGWKGSISVVEVQQSGPVYRIEAVQVGCGQEVGHEIVLKVDNHRCRW